MDRSKEPIIVRPDEDLEDIVPGYLDNRHNEMPALKKAIAENDMETLKVLGHRMKGSGAGYGFDAITEIGRNIEFGARDNNADQIQTAIAELEDYLARVEVVFD